MADAKKATKTKKAAAGPARIKVQYYRSAIGFAVHQKLVVKGLGFLKLNTIRELVDTPATRGMIAKVPHLVRIVE
jgi:large subunit ribosomal protein L30